jgi:D-beta-D-heptose 7-phosphate kinase/D-beta-D-heptose 1-phosphate adenosyltransferase
MVITVIGELCKDIFIYGETKRLSPEAPVPVFNPIHTETNNGMAGNVVENLKSLNKDLIINFIHQKTPITKTRYVDDKSNHMFLRVDDENNIDELVMTDDLIGTITNSDAVIISDYHKGFLTEKVVNEICFFSNFSVTDTKKLMSTSSFSCFDFVKLNESEFNNHTISDHWLEKIIITLGSKGAKHKGITYPSPDPKETIDVSGAGDTFTASFTLKYLETGDVAESIVFANKMASIVVSKRGVTTP